MPGLKAMVENLDTVDEGFKELYTEQDVKVGQKTEKRFVLQVEEVENHPRVKNLQTAHERQKEENRVLKRENDEVKTKIEGLPDDFSPAMFEDLKTRAEGRTNNAQEQLDRLKNELTKAHEKVVLEKDKKVENLTRGLKATKIDGGLNDALVKSGVSKEFIGAARALIKESAPLELIEEDGKFTAVVNTALGRLSIEDFVKDWVTSDEGKPMIAKAAGDDAGGNERPRASSNGANPFDRKDGRKPNQTEMQDAWVKDPAKARTLARQANWSERELAAIGLK